MSTLAILVPIAAFVGLIVAYALAAWIGKLDEGNERMKEIAGYIREGAMAFLRREYKTMAIVIVVLFLVIGFALNSWVTAILYVIGALLSVLAGFFGMKVATLGNVRTAHAADESGMDKSPQSCVQIRRGYGTLRFRSRPFQARRGILRA